MKSRKKVKQVAIHKENTEQYDPRMFQQPVAQTTTVNVTIEQAEDDGVAECMNSCFRACVSAGKNAAK